MICPNCNNEIPESSVFCPDCGYQIATEAAPSGTENASDAVQEPVTEQVAASDAEPVAKKKPATGLIIGICVVAAALIIACVAVFGSNPLVKVRNAARNTMDAQKAKVEKAGKQMTMTVSCDLESVAADLLGFNLPASADIILAADGEAQASMLKANINVSGHSLLDAFARIGKDSVSIGSDALLGENYGISLDNVQENVKGSILDPANGYISQDVYDGFMDAIENRGETVDMINDLKEIADDATDFVFKSVEKHSKAKSGKDDVDFGGKSVKVQVISVEINNGQLADIVSDTVGYLKSDAKIREKLQAVSEKYPALIEESFGIEADGLADRFYEALDTCELPAPEADEANEPAVNIDFYINDSKELAGLKLALPSEDGEAELKFGPDPSEPECIFVSADWEGESASISYQVRENSDAVYSAVFMADVSGMDLFVVHADWNKTSGEFSIYGDDFTLDLNVAQSDDGLVIAPKAVSGMGMDGYSSYLRLVTVTLSHDAEIAEEVEFKDILTMSEEEISDAVGGIEDSLMKSVYSLMF